MNKILITLLAGAAALHAAAYDFVADNGLAYNVNPDGATATLTFSAFGNNYPGVTAIEVPERVSGLGRSYTVTAVGSYALHECESLTSLTLPATVTAIGEYAAFGSERLSTLRLGSNVADIGNYAFAETGLTSVTLPAAVLTVGDYAFAKCSKLVFADVGSGVTSIGRFAFSHCKAMTTASLGANVTDILGSAFAGCTMLKTLNCAMLEPPAIEASVFGGVATSQCLLRVPRAAQERYASAPVWCTFMFAGGEVGYTVSAADVVHLRGTRGERLTIALSNEQPVSAVQLDVRMPAGVTIALDHGSPDVAVDDTRRSRDHNALVTIEGDNVVRIVLSSPTGKALKGNAGPLLSLGLDCDEQQLASGTIELTDVSVSSPEGTLSYLPDGAAAFTLQYLRGDANGDASVDVADYIVAANRLANRSTPAYFHDAADVNRNGFLDVADLVEITKRALRKIVPEVVTQP